MHMALWKKTEMLIYMRKMKKIPNSDAFTSQNKWYQTPRSTQSKENVRSKPEARKATCHAPKGITEKLHIGQGRAGLRRKPEPDCINQPSDVTRRISERSKIVTGKTNSPQHANGMCGRGISNDKSFPPDVLLHPDPLHKPLPKQQNAVSPINQNTGINLDIKENFTISGRHHIQNNPETGQVILSKPEKT